METFSHCSFSLFILTNSKWSNLQKKYKYSLLFIIWFYLIYTIINISSNKFLNSQIFKYIILALSPWNWKKYSNYLFFHVTASLPHFSVVEVWASASVFPLLSTTCTSPFLTKIKKKVCTMYVSYRNQNYEYWSVSQYCNTILKTTNTDIIHDHKQLNASGQRRLVIC